MISGLPCPRSWTTGRGEAVHEVGPRPLPENFALGRIHRDDERVEVLVADLDQLAVDQDRGGPHAVEIGERSQGQRPELGSVGTVGDETVPAEERVDVGPIGDRRRRGLVVETVHPLDPSGRSGPAPDLLAGRAVEGDGEELFLVVRRQEDSAVRHDRRGLARRQSRLPDHVGAGSEDHGQRPLFSDAGSVRPAEPRPVRCVRDAGENQQRQVRLDP